jgi:hypothetical protein
MKVNLIHPLACCIAILIPWPTTALAANRPLVNVVAKPDLQPPNAFYAGNRPPLAPSPLIKLPIGCVRPQGWAHRMLELQAQGFHGHLTEISPYLKKESNAWLSATGSGQRGWEEVPYWLKGFQDCGFLLSDERMMKEARLWIEGAIGSQQADGWFGPGEGRTGEATDLRGRDDLWPNMIMLFCLQSFYEQTGDARVTTLMERYFRYLESVPEPRFLVGYWPKMRAGDLLYSIYWLYNRTSQAWLLELADKVHRQAARWDQDLINWHNVNLAQGFREPAIYFQQTHDFDHLNAAERNWQKLRALYGQVPGGMFGGDENCRVGFTDPRQAIESCGMVEEMLSDEILLAITGNPVWADRCENVAFNSLPAALTADFKALRYLTAPNQPQSDHVSKSPGIENGGPMYQMNPHDHRCCQHNVGHGWPYFVQHLWYATASNGLAAILYAPCRVTAKVGTNVTVTWDETTHYPFHPGITMKLSTPQSVRFPLYLRVPGWCASPEIQLNGKRLRATTAPDSYVRIDREWVDGDCLELTLPMQTKVHVWQNNHQAVSVERGPLTFSAQIKERYQRFGGTDAWPAWDIYPDSAWNYGLVLPSPASHAKFRLITKPWPTDDQPFAANAVPIQLQARACRIPQWKLDDKGLVQKIQDSPVQSREPVTNITLIPMGAARLRLSVFPVMGTNISAHPWKEVVQPAITASHCFGSDSTAAVADDILPVNSGDGSIPRFTWWDHRGSNEWIQWDLPAASPVSGVQVYWFDDAGRGQCRVPESWRVYYRRGDQWMPVGSPNAYNLEQDKFNTTTFDSVQTDALRLVVKLRPGFSAGILEWKIIR